MNWLDETPYDHWSPENYLPMDWFQKSAQPNILPAGGIASSRFYVMEPDAVYGAGGSGLRILCVDDDPTMGKVLLRLFLAAGHHAELAADGLVAWEKIQACEDSYDLILTDHEMPRMDGLDLVSRLRAANFAGRIIVHSNSLYADSADEYRALSVDRFVPKGTGRDELLGIVEAICGSG